MLWLLSFAHGRAYHKRGGLTPKIVYADLPSSFPTCASAHEGVTLIIRAPSNFIIGGVILPVASLSDGKLHEQWYPLFSADAHVYVSGDIHLRIDHNNIAKTINVRGMSGARKRSIRCWWSSLNNTFVCSSVKLIIVLVIEGRNLASKDANGLSDPYVKVNFNKQKKKTKVIKYAPHFTWHQPSEAPYLTTLESMHTNRPTDPVLTFNRKTLNPFFNEDFVLYVFSVDLTRLCLPFVSLVMYRILITNLHQMRKSRSRCRWNAGIGIWLAPTTIWGRYAQYCFTLHRVVKCHIRRPAQRLPESFNANNVVILTSFVLGFYSPYWVWT